MSIGTTWPTKSLALSLRWKLKKLKNDWSNEYFDKFDDTEPFHYKDTTFKKKDIAFVGYTYNGNVDMSSTPGLDYALEKLEELQVTNGKEKKVQRMSERDSEEDGQKTEKKHVVHNERQTSQSSAKGSEAKRIVLLNAGSRLSDKDVKSRVSPSLRSKMMLNKFKISPSRVNDKKNLSPTQKTEVVNYGGKIFTSIKNSMKKTSPLSNSKSLKTEESLPNITRVKK